MKKLIVATSNPGKLQEIKEYLRDLDWELALKPEHLEIEETGKTFLENACLKASETAKILGEWALGDDSGLAVAALEGAPGIYSSRYGNSDNERIARLLRELGAENDRKAKFVCALAIARPDGTIALQTEGICEGEILYEPQGKQGFGYDPVFYVPQQGITFAQMKPEVKQQMSHRGKAFAQLIPKLGELLIGG